MRCVALILCLCAALWTGALLQQRRALRLERHLLRAAPLPFAPAGRPVLHPDGRVFLVTAPGARGAQLVALEPDGRLSWSKQLPGPVTPQPLLVRSDLLVLQGEGRLYGFSLGGDPRFSVDDGGTVGDLPCADEAGDIFLLDRAGALAGFSPAGAVRFRTPLGLTEARRVAVLPTGQLLAAGGGADGFGLALGEPSGLVIARRTLPAAPAGLAASPRAGELFAVTAGAEVIAFSAGAEPLRTLALPGIARSAPLLLADGGALALVGRGGDLSLCRAGGSCAPLGPLEALDDDDGLPVGPVLGRDGLVYAAFFAPGRWLLPDHQGVLALGPAGVAWRQALPARVSLAGLTLGWDGAARAVAADERVLWQFADSLGQRDRYHPWPMPAGNPAGSSRTWPERP